MAKYKEIGGTPVAFKSGSEEYTYPSGAEGELYYNSSNGQFQFVGLGAGTWASGGALNTARTQHAGAGTLTAGIVFAGDGGGDALTITEKYDGTSWTEVANVAAGRSYTSSTGTGSGNSNTQSLFYGGATTSSTANTNATEEWNQALETISFDID